MNTLEKIIAEIKRAASVNAVWNLLTLAACNGMVLLCQLASAYVLIKTLGNSDYGRLQFATSFQPYIHCIVSLAGGAISLRLIRSREFEIGNIVSSATVSSLTLGSLVVVVSLSLVFGLASSNVERIFLVAVALAALSPALNLYYLYDAKSRHSLGSMPAVAAEFLSFALLAVLYSAEKLSPLSMSCIYVLKMYSIGVLQWVVLLRCLADVKWRPTVSTARRIVIDSIPSILTALIWNAYNTLSVLLVRLYLGSEANAMYGLALMFASIFVMSTDLLLRVLAPQILGEAGMGRQFVVRLAVLLPLFLVASSVVLYLVAVVYRVLLLGEEYRLFTSVLAWLLAAAALRGIWECASCYLLRFGCLRLSLASMVSIVAVSAVIGFSLKDRLGVLAFSIASVFAYLIAVPVHVYLAYYYWGENRPSGVRLDR